MSTRRLWCYSCEQMVDAEERVTKDQYGFRYFCPRCGGGTSTGATRPQAVYRNPGAVIPAWDEENERYEG